MGVDRKNGGVREVPRRVVNPYDKDVEDVSYDAYKGR